MREKLRWCQTNGITGWERGPHWQKWRSAWCCLVWYGVSCQTDGIAGWEKTLIDNKANRVNGTAEHDLESEQINKRSKMLVFISTRRSNRLGVLV